MAKFGQFFSGILTSKSRYFFWYFLPPDPRFLPFIGTFGTFFGTFCLRTPGFCRLLVLLVLFLAPRRVKFRSLAAYSGFRYFFWYFFPPRTLRWPWMVKFVEISVLFLVLFASGPPVFAVYWYFWYFFWYFLRL